MPSSRATARSDSAAAPSAARCRRATSVISRVSSARTRARVRLRRVAEIGMDESVGNKESTALDNAAPRGEHSTEREQCSRTSEDPWPCTSSSAPARSGARPPTPPRRRRSQRPRGQPRRRRTGPPRDRASGRRRDRRRAAHSDRRRRDGPLQLREPALPPLVDRLAPTRCRASHGRGANRRRAGHHGQPVRLRPGRRPHDRGHSAALGRRHEGPIRDRMWIDALAAHTRPGGSG